MHSVFFDSENSKIFRGFDLIVDRDHRERTEKDKRFLEQYDTIFLAAANGNLRTCLEVIQEGFRDFSAYSIGRFRAKEGDFLNISPLQMAVINKHFAIVHLFEDVTTNLYECVDLPTKVYPSFYNSIESEGYTITSSNQIIKFENHQKKFGSENHRDVITGLIVQNGLAFTSSDDKTLKSWDIKTAKCLKTFRGHFKPVVSLCEQGDFLFSGSWDGRIKIWDIHSGLCIKTLSSLDCEVIAISVEGRYLVSAINEELKCSIQIWDLDKESCIKTFQVHDQFLSAILIHNGCIYSGSDEGMIDLWNLEGEHLNSLVGHSLRIKKLKFEGDKLISESSRSVEKKSWILR